MSRHRRSLNTLDAMKIGAHLPQWLWRPIGHIVIAVLVARRSRPVRQLAMNYEVVTGEAPSQAVVRKAMKSWLENVMISLQLGNWSPRRIRRKVIVDDPPAWQRLKDLCSQGGLVIALPHMGCWDLVGAYGGLEELPVTSVAEALPDGQFEYFRLLREKLGIKIYSTAERHVFELLRDDLDEGRLVSLVSDRDFGRRGVPVTWDFAAGAMEQTLPPGPAMLAQQGPHPLMGAATYLGEHRKLHLVLAGPVEVAPGRQGLIDASQWLTDFFATQICAHPTDWHMLQRFFKGVTP